MTLREAAQQVADALAHEDLEERRVALIQAFMHAYHEELKRLPPATQADLDYWWPKIAALNKKT